MSKNNKEQVFKIEMKTVTLVCGLIVISFLFYIGSLLGEAFTTFLLDNEYEQNITYSDQEVRSCLIAENKAIVVVEPIISIVEINTPGSPFVKYKVESLNEVSQVMTHRVVTTDRVTRYHVDDLVGPLIKMYFKPNEVNFDSKNAIAIELHADFKSIEIISEK